MEEGDEGRAAARSAGWAVASLGALGASVFAWVRPTNFRGYDEWLVFSLLSRGIVSFPYANRPLNLVWALPAWALAPDRLWGFLLVHTLWLTLSGALVFLLLRRIHPGAPELAFLAGAFTVVWAPADLTRLASVQMIVYSGCTFGVLVSCWMLAESWRSRRATLALAAAAAGVAAVLSLEAALPLVVLAPFLLLACGGWREWTRWRRWGLAWLVLMGVVAWRVMEPLWSRSAEVAYQTDVLVADRLPLLVLHRLVSQLRRHLLPLVTSPVRELAVAAVPLALAVFAVGFVLAVRRRAPTRSRPAPRPWALLLTGVGGLLAAILGYLPFVLVRTHGPVRTQFLSTPGVAVLLAAALVLLTRSLPARSRLGAACLLGGWIVAVGAGRTLALQELWNIRSAYPAQRRTLLDLTALAPDLEPHTLVIVLNEAQAWPFDFSFRHAVEYLYDGRARGHAADVDHLLYETRFEPGGVVSEPLPVLRGPWHEPVERYAYGELVVFRKEADGRLILLDAWPSELPPLANDVAYAPRSRIRTDAPPLPRLSILARR
jgi:hypothetical protein